MPNARQIRFATTIKAPADVVWAKMLGADTYPRWTAAFSEGSYYEGSWSQGSSIRFLSPSGEGMVAEIAGNRPNEFLSIRQIGVVANGVEDTESDAVRAWAPAYENYTLVHGPEGTKVVIDQDVNAEFEKFMKDTWAKAFASLKQLCEDDDAG